MSDQLTPHFKRLEFACSDCGIAAVDYKVLEYLETARVKAGVPFEINSGYRCFWRNWQLVKEGLASPKSMHMAALAVDVARPNGITIDELALLLQDAGFTGIGKYDWGCHSDIGRLRTWDRR